MTMTITLLLLLRSPNICTWKNQVDFLKINGGVWGAINFNNMIPIHSDQLEHIDIRILPTDDKATVELQKFLHGQSIILV